MQHSPSSDWGLFGEVRADDSLLPPAHTGPRLPVLGLLPAQSGPLLSTYLKHFSCIPAKILPPA